MRTSSMKWAIAVVTLALGVTTAAGEGNGASSAPGLTFSGKLTGAQQVPEVASDAVGTVTARFDAGFTRVTVQIRLKGDIQVVAGHFHCARAGVNGPVAFGLLAPGPLSEIVDGTKVTITNAQFTTADCVPTTGRPINNIAALALAMRDGLVYANLHTPTFLGGQIRAQMVPDEPHAD